MYRKVLRTLQDCLTSHRYSSVIIVRNVITDVSIFQNELQNAKKVAVLTGSGIAIESGLPLYSPACYTYKHYEPASLSTPEGFEEDPGLVWEYFYYRRQLATQSEPNAAHIALANFEKEHSQSKKVTIIAQAIDGLQAKTGSEVIELHGNLFQTRCTMCGNIDSLHESKMLDARIHTKKRMPKIKIEELPHCHKCKGLLRPNVRMYGEDVDEVVAAKAETAVTSCNMLLVIATSLLTLPAADYVPLAAEHDAIIAEFNIQPTPTAEEVKYYFAGPCAHILPNALKIQKAQKIKS